MRITHLAAAAALAAGLLTAAPAAQAAPLTSPAAPGWHAVSSDAARSAKAKTKISATAPTEVQAGEAIDVTAQLTRKSGSKYKAYAKKKLELVLLDGPGAETGSVVDTEKTSKKGKVTFVGSFDDASVGQSYDFLVAYEGGSKAKASESDVFTITVTS